MDIEKHKFGITYFCQWINSKTHEDEKIPRSIFIIGNPLKLERLFCNLFEEGGEKLLKDGKYEIQTIQETINALRNSKPYGNSFTIGRLEDYEKLYCGVGNGINYEFDIDINQVIPYFVFHIQYGLKDKIGERGEKDKGKLLEKRFQNALLKLGANNQNES